jgi:hypothetical protein
MLKMETYISTTNYLRRKVAVKCKYRQLIVPEIQWDQILRLSAFSIPLGLAQMNVWFPKLRMKY